MGELCGCRIEVDYDGPRAGAAQGVPVIAYCPLHAAASELRDALKLLVSIQHQPAAFRREHGVVPAIRALSLARAKREESAR